MRLSRATARSKICAASGCPSACVQDLQDDAARLGDAQARLAQHRLVVHRFARRAHGGQNSRRARECKAAFLQTIFICIDNGAAAAYCPRDPPNPEDPPMPRLLVALIARLRPRPSRRGAGPAEGRHHLHRHRRHGAERRRRCGGRRGADQAGRGDPLLPADARRHPAGARRRPRALERAEPRAVVREVPGQPRRGALGGADRGRRADEHHRGPLHRQGRTRTPGCRRRTR